MLHLLSILRFFQNYGRIPLSHINVPTKRRWNGNEFFGLNREDVRETLKNAPSEVTPTEIKTSNIDMKSNSHHTSVWVGVISVGDIDVCKDSKAGFSKKIGTKVLYFPPGYEAVRNMKLGNSQMVPLHCKVEQRDSIPIFTCYTKDLIIFSVSSENMSKVVKEALLKLGISSTRRWSGYDFFGITRSDVISYFEEALHGEDVTTSDDDDVEVKTLPKVLKTVLDIRHRNAGPTSSLSKRAQKERNEKIHKLVGFVSFGDVIGIQLKYFFTLENVWLSFSISLKSFSERNCNMLIEFCS